MNKATLYAIDSCFSNTKTKWNSVPIEFSLGHIGVKIYETIYGLRPPTTELIEKIVDGKVDNDTLFFQQAQQFVPIYTQDILISNKSTNTILEDHFNKTQIPYCIFAHKQTKESYNCVSYLREKAELDFLPNTTSIHNIIQQYFKLNIKKN